MSRHVTYHTAEYHDMGLRTTENAHLTSENHHTHGTAPKDFSPGAEPDM